MKARAARTLRNWLDELKVAEECNLPRGPSLTCPSELSRNLEVSHPLSGQHEKSLGARRYCRTFSVKPEDTQKRKPPNALQVYVLDLLTRCVSY